MMTKANTKYKTVKRKANVGERILITNANTSMGFYGNGDVLTVESLYNVISSGVRAKETRQDCPFIRHDEYEVIVEESPSNSERITALESQVAELQAELQTLKKRKKPKHLLTHYPTPNEQRKAVIERAKEFVEKVSQEAYDGKGVRDGNEIYKLFMTRPEFHVNKNKRTVTALVKGAVIPKLYSKGIAKCAPDDVFNADIGKAIALGRALGLDVSEFENAPKPTEVVVGMEAEIRGNIGSYIDTIVGGDTGHYHCVESMKCNKDRLLRITDDTEAQY